MNKQINKEISSPKSIKTKSMISLFPLIIVYIFKYFQRGLNFIFIDTPKHILGLDKKNNTHNILTMDIKELFSYQYMSKKKLAKLEKTKIELENELKNDKSQRSEKANVYQYLIKDENNHFLKGIMSGYSKLDIHTYLVQNNYTVYKIETNKYLNYMYGNDSIFASKIKNKDLVFWLTGLSTYLKSGITLTEAIKILNTQMTSKYKYKRAFQSIAYELSMGESFSVSLSKQGLLFPPLLINMIKASEKTGEIIDTLDDMATYYEKIEQTHKQMISALTYPLVILFFALIVVAFVLIWVIPQFVTMYDEASATLPTFTLNIIKFSNYLKNNYLNIIAIIISIIILLIIAYKNIQSFRKTIQTLLMKIPVIGKIIIYNEVTILTKTFASLLKNNVFITDSIEILSKLTTNEVYKEIMYNTIENILDGKEISISFKNHFAIPNDAYQMIVTGEKTGELPEMMNKVSNYYQQMHTNCVNNLKAFIEPVMIILLSLIVGIIILAVVIPMFSIMNEIKI